MVLFQIFSCACLNSKMTTPAAKCGKNLKSSTFFFRTYAWDRIKPNLMSNSRVWSLSKSLPVDVVNYLRWPSQLILLFGVFQHYLWFLISCLPNILVIVRWMKYKSTLILRYLTVIVPYLHVCLVTVRYHRQVCAMVLISP